MGRICPLPLNILMQLQVIESLIGAEEVLTQPNLSLRNLKERILKADRLKKILEDSGGHPSLKYVLIHNCKG